MVADLVESPPAATAYDDIKNRLVASHQLTDFQKAEKLFQMPALGSRKPLDLMAAMLETCLRGEEKSNLFACIFLQRLPREIRVLLANVDHKDPKALATRADELWALHDNPGTSTSSTVDVVQPEGQEVDFVAAVRTGSQRGGNSRGGARGGNRGRGGQGAARGGGAAHEPEASKEARLAAGMCFKLWRYGDAATSCTQPCSWQGNGGAGGQLNAVAPGELLHLTDKLSGRRFLVDIGASYSIFPHQSSQPVCGPVLKGPGGQTIACWGDAAAGAVLRPPFYLDFSIGKSRISNSWCRFFEAF
jgi:hypothetical protein